MRHQTLCELYRQAHVEQVVEARLGLRPCPTDEIIQRKLRNLFGDYTPRVPELAESRAR